MTRYTAQHTYHTIHYFLLLYSTIFHFFFLLSTQWIYYLSPDSKIWFMLFFFFFFHFNCKWYFCCSTKDIIGSFQHLKNRSIYYYNIIIVICIFLRFFWSITLRLSSINWTRNRYIFLITNIKTRYVVFSSCCVY